MSSFTYNDTTFTVTASGAAWDLTRGPEALVAAGVFPGASAEDASSRALALVKTIFPVGVKCVGPDVAHPNTIGDLKIVGPDVTHPNFIYWNKDSVSCPKEP